MRKYLLYVLVSCVSCELSADYCQPFPLYDGTSYKLKSKQVAEYLEPLTLIYGHKMYPERKKTSKLPPLDYARHHVEEEIVKKSEIIVYDIEHWPIRGFYKKPWKRQVNLNKYDEIMESIRLWFPDKKVGYFGLFPLNDYEGIAGDSSSQRYKWWLEDNDATQYLSKYSDIIFPSFYTYNTDFNEWVVVAEKKLKVAKKMNPDKQILAFLWPQYSDRVPTPKSLRNKFMPEGQWLKQLYFMQGRVDGVVIWGGFDLENSRHFHWNNKAAWWKTTKQFIKNIRNMQCSE